MREILVDYLSVAKTARTSVVTGIDSDCEESGGGGGGGGGGDGGGGGGGDC